MKVTEEMLAAFSGADFSGCGNADWEDEHLRRGIQAVLDLLPDVKPFAFTGYPDNPVYLHPSCGTVVDVNPAMTGTVGSRAEQVADGECDCENTMPWLRIYVEAK